MTDTVIATRATITIGPLSVDGFMLPDGSYRMSQKNVADAVGKPAMNASRFLGSKAIKGLLGGDYTDHGLEQIAIGTGEGKRGQSRINALPLEVVTAYWIHQCSQGNKKAIALVMALATETLERRFDNVFGIEKSEDDYNAMLFKRVESLETDVGEAYVVADDMARENEELWFYIRENNLPGPYKLEDGD